jgi:hypothetical protein
MAASVDKRIGSGMRVGRQLFSTAILQAQIASCCCTRSGADLQIAATLRPLLDPATGRAGLMLTMFVTSNGPSIASGVTVTATVPALAVKPPAIQASPVSQLVLAGSQLQASLGSILNGESRSLQCFLLPFPLRFTAALLKLVVQVSGSVSATNIDPVPQNNTFFVSADAPFPATVTDFTGGGAMPVNKIVVTFSKKLQPASVNKNTFLIINATTGALVAPDQITYDDAGMKATFSVTGKGIPAGTYAARLVGSGPAPITDQDGFALDGDQNGIPGGNFTKPFGVG